MYSKRAFSLVELLTVVAVIGVLGSIATIQVTSALQRSRDSAAKAETSAIAKNIEAWKANESSVGYLRVVSGAAPALTTAGPQNGWELYFTGQASQYPTTATVAKRGTFYIYSAEAFSTAGASAYNATATASRSAFLYGSAGAAHGARTAGGYMVGVTYLTGNPNVGTGSDADSIASVIRAPSFVINNGVATTLTSTSCFVTGGWLISTECAVEVVATAIATAPGGVVDVDDSEARRPR